MYFKKLMLNNSEIVILMILTKFKGKMLTKCKEKNLPYLKTI